MNLRYNEDRLELKNDVNICTVNDSSELNNSTDSSISQSESDGTDSFDSSESNCSNNQECVSTFSEHENVNDDTSFEFVENKDALSVFYTNADNLLNKIDELKVRIQQKFFDVLVIT